MIKGHATPEATRAFLSRHLPVGHMKMGMTGLTVSQAGFGCYRVVSGHQPHEEALRRALLSGINLIDTSANYTDGGSENLIGRFLTQLLESESLSRSEVIVVSKAGYLQGQNYAVSQQRKQEGRPFPELVEYDQGLEHCIHPEFLEDQLDRSLDRLNLETLDFYLLHNPEYYLSWAEKKDIPRKTAEEEYYRRIETAFAHLEKEVQNGRVRFYGISSNTFPATSDDPAFTSLETVWKIAESVSPRHHFRLIQMPFNILEPGAVLEKNQDDGRSVLEFAVEKNIAVLINRPLNAFSGRQLIRLAEIDECEATAREENEIIESIGAVSRSETTLLRRILPSLNIQSGLMVRIREQVAVGDGLKHYWRNFGSYERWRQVKDANFQPRVKGVMDFLAAHTEKNPELADWMVSHARCLKEAYVAVGSIYAEAQCVKLARIKRAISAADPDWQPEGTISQKAFRAVRSTKGVSSVLIGMRKEDYVDDIVEELSRPILQKNRRPSWEAILKASDRFLH